MYEKITVDLGPNSYSIIILYELIDIEFYWLLRSDSIVCLITDDQVAELHLDRLYKLLMDFGLTVSKLILPSGESTKTLKMLEYIITELLNKGYNRDLILIAFGGGVIGDLVGFAAATYQRGIRFIQLPTTLLSQVDASIGGKTGVNHFLAKNMIGVFYQPSVVIINLDFLNTLSRQEFVSGLAEVIKYGIALDLKFFEWLEINLDSVLNLEPRSLMYCVHRCCELKGNIVSVDERDTGIRSLLNYGHTYGHAIESYFGYRTWSHGESISVGMMMAANLSYHLGYLSSSDVDRVRRILLRAGLPVWAPENMQVQDYLAYMSRDKKNFFNKISFVLPTSIGHTVVSSKIAYEAIEASIRSTMKVS